MARLTKGDLQELQRKLNTGEMTKDLIKILLFECAWLKNYYDSIRGYGEQIIRSTDIAQGKVTADANKENINITTDVGELKNGQ